MVMWEYQTFENFMAYLAVLGACQSKATEST